MFFPMIKKKKIKCICILNAVVVGEMLFDPRGMYKL